MHVFGTNGKRKSKGQLANLHSPENAGQSDVCVYAYMPAWVQICANYLYPACSVLNVSEPVDDRSLLILIWMNVYVRLLHDHSSVAGLHSQALDTLQEKLTDAEAALRLETEQHRKTKVWSIELSRMCSL